MDTNEILKKATNYYKNEYEILSDVFEHLKNNNRYNYATASNYVDSTIKMYLGIAQFSQSLGVSFEDIDPIYEEYKKKLEDLI